MIVRVERTVTETFEVEIDDDTKNYVADAEDVIRILAKDPVTIRRYTTYSQSPNFLYTGLIK